MSPETNTSGKIHDPVFLCMIGAIILAVVSSIALRTFVAGVSPAPAQAEGTDHQAPHAQPGKSVAHAHSE